MMTIILLLVVMANSMLIMIDVMILVLLIDVMKMKTVQFVVTMLIFVDC